MGGVPNNSREGEARRRATDRLINAVLDAEADGALHESRTLRTQGQRVDDQFDAQLDQTRRSVASLSLWPEGPDVSARVLGELSRDGRFVSRRKRWKLSAGRLAVTAGALAVFAAAMFVRRVAPLPVPMTDGATVAVASPGPVSDLVETASADLTQSIRSILSASGQVREDLFAPVGTLVTQGAGRVRHNSGALTLGNTEAYEVSKPSMRRTPTRLALVSAMSEDTVPVSGGPTPTRRLAEPPSSLLMPSPVVARTQPTVASGVPAEAWMMWDGGRWVRGLNAETPAGGRR